MRCFYSLILAMFLSSSSDAEVHVNLNFNIESQPIWGPTGYDHVEYYYLPDIEVYYNVPLHRFIYFQRGRWITRSSLPSRYRGYDLYHSYKVVVNERAPYRNHKMYREKYSSYRNHHDQQPIRDSHDSRYFVNRNHPEHKSFVNQQVRDHGNGNDRNATPSRNAKPGNSGKKNDKK